MIEEENAEPHVAKPTSSWHSRDANRVPQITGRDPFVSSHSQAPNAITAARIIELEIENLRLQRLVAELLIKNQQLRKRD